MKKNLLSIALFAMVTSNVNAQECLSSGYCGNLNTNYPMSPFGAPGSPFIATSTWTQISSFVNGGNYAYYHVDMGCTYFWSTCDAFGGSQAFDAQFTLKNASFTNLCFSDNYCGTSGHSPYISWTATYTGNAVLLVSAFTTVGCQNNGPTAPYCTVVWGKSPSCCTISVPSGFTKSSTCTSITLNWNSVAGATSYAIYDCNSNQYLSPVTTNSVTYTGLSSNSTYSLAIAAVNGTCTSALSACQNITTTLQPAIPSGFAKSSTCTSITLNWNSVSGATSYAIYDCSANQYLSPVTTNSVTYTGLSSSSTYSLAIAAVSPTCTSALSACQSITTTSQPAVPSGFTNSSTSTSITLNWNAVPGATSYAIYDCNSSQYLSPVTTNSVTYIGLASGSTYSLAVAAVTSTCSSALSACQNITTLTIATATITNFTISPSAVCPGGTFSITNIVNASAAINNVIIGASIAPTGTTNYINDIPNDLLVSLPSGLSTQIRSFTIPVGTAAGNYDVVSGLWKDNNANGIIDAGDVSLSSLTKIGILTVSSSGCSGSTGTWTAVATLAPHFNNGGMLLLSDGTVLAKSTGGGGNGTIYDKLTPVNGSYVNGIWSSIAPMHNDRLFYSSQVLKDGHVYVAGGEYPQDASGNSLGSNAEVYDPLTNVWTTIPSSGFVYSDANSEILDNGNVLQATNGNNWTQKVIYNPSTNTYSNSPNSSGITDETAWVKLPDGSILFLPLFTSTAERYIPSSDTWAPAGICPISLYDPIGLEAGAGFLLPDGRAFFIGGTNSTAYYTPSTNTWAVGPNMPILGTDNLCAPDAAAAMLVNGKILCALSPPITCSICDGQHNIFNPPTSFWEFDYLNNGGNPNGGTFTQVGAPGGGSTINQPSFLTNMLDLPDGKVLFAMSQVGSNQYYVYTPATGIPPLTIGKPTINNITQNSCNSYTITGTLFNGISEGASYGDDWQMASNYPIIRLTNGTNVYYCRTFNWNSTGVQRGNLPDNTQFTLPTGLPNATYSLVVTANGISSDPITLNTAVNPPPSIVVVSGGGTFCNSAILTASGGNGGTIYWQNTTSGGTSTATASTSQPITASGTYYFRAYNGCLWGPEGSAVVIINTPPAPVTVSGSGLSCSNMTLTANGGSSGTIYWQGTTNNGTSQATPSTSQTVNSSGTYYFRSFNSACGWGIQGFATVTINTPPNNWTGAVSTAWENSGNWSCGVVADGNTDVLISSGTCIVNSNATCRSLKVMPGVVFKVNTGFTFTIMH